MHMVVQVCSTTQLNSDSSVYLTGCTVGGRSVDYTYGSEETTPIPSYQAYSVGDHVSYNNITYYVIEDSDENSGTVKLLKENPLLKTEIDALNLSGITVTDSNGYGKVEYGNSVDYSTSTVKQVVDAQKATAVANGDSVTARLITIGELVDNFSYELYDTGSRIDYHTTSTTPEWVYNSNYYYWTMSQYESQYDNPAWNMWYVDKDGFLYGDGKLYSYSYTRMAVVRPVLELSKTADISIIN